MRNRRHGAALAAILGIVLMLRLATANAADSALVDAAKKEGHVVWYTTLIVNQAVRPLVAAFQEKYPGIEVSYSRADSGPTALKILNEARAGKVQADIFDGTGTVPPLVQAGLVANFLPDNADKYPPELKDPQGHWIAINLYFLTPGYNTQLVPKDEAPKTLNDLLDPKWKGKMAWSTSATAGSGTFIGRILETMGETRGMDYLTALAKQDVVNVDASGRTVLDQVIAGEYPLALEIFNHHAALSAAKGAPVDWIKMTPVSAPISVASLLKDAPHPNAARLFLDFLASEDGQKVMAAVDYLPALPSVPAKVPTLKPEAGGFTAHFMPPEIFAQKGDHWEDVAKQVFHQ
jgi:ABC-type Fe3+ transport system substrate-binding protein